MPTLQKNAKKRPAPSQGGPKTKKPHVSKQTISKSSDENVKKRRHPVTLPVKEASDDGSEEDDEGDDVEGGEEIEVDAPEENEMAVDSALPKDPNGKDMFRLRALYLPHIPCRICRTAARESHKAQRVLQDQRRAAKPHSQLLASAKRVWSLARQKNIPSTERQKHVRDLMDIVKGKVKDIVLKHDASRIIQTIVKYGGQKERDQIARELKGHYKELAQSKYSKVNLIFEASSSCLSIGRQVFGY
jgi:pumilio family protein 6